MAAILRYPAAVGKPKMRRPPGSGGDFWTCLRSPGLLREPHHRPSALAPQVAGEFLRHGLAVLRPFAGEEGWPVGGGGEAFAVGSAEGEEHREAAFTEDGMLFEREAILQLHLRFR